MQVIKAVSPSAVVDEYAPRHGGPVHLREILALSLREGSIRARAFSRWESEESLLRDAWKEQVKEPDPINRSYKEVHDITRSVWWRSVSWSSDILDWDFRKARMHVTLSETPRRRLMLSRVESLADDIRRVLGPKTLDLPERDFGKLTNKEAWRRFWHQIVILSAGNIETLKDSSIGQLKSDDAVYRVITGLIGRDNEILGDGELSDTIVGAKVAAVMPFNLSPSAILEEIKALRQTLQLKRDYVVRKRR